MRKVEGYSIDVKIDGVDFGSVVHVFEDLPKLAEGVQEVRKGLENDGYKNIELTRVNLDKTGAALRRLAGTGIKYTQAC